MSCAVEDKVAVKFLRRLFFVFRPILTRRFILGYFYNLLCNLCSVKKDFVFLESHHGSDFFGSPYYMALNLARDVKYEYLRLIVVAPRSREAWLRRKFCGRPLTIIRPRSLAYVYFLAVSAWLVSDVTFPLYFNRRKGQRYLNTWHGTPLKSLGRDTPNETFSYVGNTQRNLFHADFILSPNEFTENVLLDAYMIRGGVGGPAS